MLPRRVMHSWTMPRVLPFCGRRRLEIAGFCLLLLVLLFCPPVARGGVVPGEVVVRFAEGALREDKAAPMGVALPAKMDALEQRFGLRAHKPLIEPPAVTGAQKTAGVPSRTYLMRFDPAVDVTEVRAALEGDPSVLYAEPNYRGRLASAPNDPLYHRQAEDFAVINLEAAWGIQPGAQGVTVAIVDSGVEAVHPDLSGALDLEDSYNFIDDDTNVFDDLGHGTRAAGIIGAVANNNEGIAGVAHGARLLSMDVADAQGNITTADVASAVNLSVARGADIINLGLRFSADSQVLREACAAAVEAGAVLVASAGNENRGDVPVFPASYPSVIGVGALAKDGESRASFSNFSGAGGDLAELVAPGTEIFSTIPGGQYNGSYGSGTSFSAAMVSGVAALMKAHHPEQSGAAIRAHLLETADAELPDFLPEGGAGHGRLDAEAALSAPMMPHLTVARVEIEDPADLSPENNEDGTLDVGETARLRVVLRNDGADVPGLTGTLSATDPQVTVEEAEGSWAAIGHGESTPAEEAFVVSVAEDSEARRLEFAMEVFAGEEPIGTVTFDVRVENALTVTSGIYFTPQTWTADNTYHVMVTQNFNEGLTVEAGTVVKVAPGVDINITGGEFIAEGTEEEPIVFTALGGGPLDASGSDIPVGGMLSARSAHTMVYDSARQRVVLFGGISGSARMGDTWELDGTQWRRVSTTGPSNRNTHAAVYDSARQRVVIFGGFDGDSQLGDTWEWDGLQWEQVNTMGPPARHWHSMAYDEARERVVLFGGSDGESILRDHPRSLTPAPPRAFST